MTQLNFFGGLMLATALLFSGCTTTQIEVVIEEALPARIANPVPESIPELEVVEVVEVEPEIQEPLPELPQVVEEPVAPAEPEPESLTILGFIKYVELEGGFFGIMTEDGAKYFPEYLEPDFKQDGLNVRVVALPQEQILGIQMWGMPIKILKIEAN
tara:strand:- start:5005 stop:5475 length:471 start_codon:yes stop_codon:yes gene_type:complete